MSALDWSLLHYSEAHNYESLLIRFRFGENGYRVQITDLANVWTEELSKEQVISTANASECSIDPSDDPSQYPILLQKLENTLHQDEGSKLRIGRLDNGNLQLHVESPLPHPLDPLSWTFRLERSSETSLRSDVIMPLIGLSFTQKQQIQDLVHTLGRKDLLIGKMLQLAHANGVHPSALLEVQHLTKALDQDEYLRKAQKRVNGLPKFDETSWSENFAETVKIPASLHEFMLQGFQGSDDPTLRAKLDLESLTRQGFSRVEKNPQSEQHSIGFYNFTNQKDTQTGEFQRQSTPPHLAKRTRNDAKSSSCQQNTLHILPADDESTTDESSPEAVETRVASSPTESDRAGSSPPQVKQESSPASQTRHDQPATRRLGKLGRVAQEAESTLALGRDDSASKPATTSTGRRLGRLGARQEETNKNAKTVEEKGASSSVQVAASQPEDESEGHLIPASQGSTRRLGKLGGRTNVNTAAKEVDESSAEPLDRSQGTPLNHMPQTDGASKEDVHSSPAAEPAEEPTDPAAERRARLKRELEQQRGKAASKKKRRF